MSQTRISYDDEQQPLEGYLAAPDSARNLPGVLLAPSWLNVNESICRRADRLADLGYAALVVDLFGAGVCPGPQQNPMDVVGPLLNDRLRFRRRLCAGLQALRALGRLAGTSQPCRVGLRTTTARTLVVRISSRLCPGTESDRIYLGTPEAARGRQSLPQEPWRAEPARHPRPETYASPPHSDHGLLAAGRAFPNVTILCNTQ
jgi:Dienelactone hydrolase family